MPVTLATVASLVIAEINANTAYAAVSTDPRFYTQQVTDAILSVDGQIVERICSNPLHGRRKDYLSSSVVAHAAQIPTHLGPIESVIIGGKAAMPFDKWEIEIERENPLGLTLTPRHYALEGDTLYHNALLFGTDQATVAYCVYVRTGACQAPEEYMLAEVAGALALLANVEGENATMASFYNAQFFALLRQIEAGQTPAFQSMTEAANG